MTIISQFDTFKGSHVTKLAPQSESCQVCGWYGYPGQKIIREFKGIRSEDEEGFVDKFTEYDCDAETGEKGNKHIHRFDAKLVQEYVDSALKLRNGV